MYTQDAITALMFRIGWAQPLDPTSNIVLDIDNVAKDSGRTVESFHKLASVENIYAAVSVVNMDMDDFNAYLTSVRTQATLAVLNETLETHIKYDFDKDYTDMLTQKAPIFDDAIGYTVAIAMLELFISSNRKNLTERNAALSYQSLKVELEGAKNDQGFSVSTGIMLKRYYAIKQIKKILFQNDSGISGSNGWT
jgi:hypothetical protein